VLVVDDGVATGATTKAAVELLRSKGPRGIVLAVPVGPPHSIAELRDLADEVICLQTASSFSAVGQFYQSFEQVTDEEAMAYLHGETAT
jgi:predicted phosphoribosyltransferase